jgi:hypothetical protein
MQVTGGQGITLMEFVDALSTLELFEHPQNREASVDMATNTAIPTEWLDVFAGRSLRTIAAAADMSVDRVSRFIKGHPVADGTADLVADALGISTRKALELRGEPVVEPFRLPDKAHYLNRRQRDAVLSVIDAMLEPTSAGNVIQGRWGDRSTPPPALDAPGVAADADGE